MRLGPTVANSALSLSIPLSAAVDAVILQEHRPGETPGRSTWHETLHRGETLDATVSLGMKMKR